MLLKHNLAFLSKTLPAFPTKTSAFLIQHKNNQLQRLNHTTPFDQLWCKYFTKTIQKRREVIYSTPTTLKGLTKNYTSKQQGIPQSIPKSDMVKLVLMRVIKTCQIYLRASLDERQKINAMSESRYAYVKPKLDNLSKSQQLEFLEYVDQKFQFANAYSTESKRRLRASGKKTSDNAIEVHETSEKQEDEYLERTCHSFNKGHIIRFLGSEQYGLLLLRFIFNFLDPNNADFKCYMSRYTDEEKIGEITERRKRQKRNNIEYVLTNRLDALRADFKEIKEYVQLEQAHVQDMLASRANTKVPNSVYVLVLDRVVEACKTYFKLSQQEREAIGREERLYYIKLRISKLNMLQQRRLLEYLNYKKNLVKAISYENTAESLEYYFSKDGVANFLNVLTHRAVLTDIILEFLKEENTDFELFLKHLKEDDTPDAMVKHHKAVRDCLTKRLKVVRMYFEQYNTKPIVY